MEGKQQDAEPGLGETGLGVAKEGSAVQAA